MVDTRKFDVVIGAVDAYSQQLNKSQKDFQKTAKSIGESFKSAFNKVTVGLIALGTGLFAATKHFAEIDKRLIDMSKFLNVDIGSLQEYNQVMKHVNVTSEDFTQILLEQNLKLGEANQKTGEAVEGLSLLGVSLDDLRGLDTIQQFELLVGKLRDVEDVTRRVNIANLIWAEDGKKLLTLLETSSTQIEIYKNNARDYGLILSSETIVATNKFNKAMLQLTSRVEGLKRSTLALDFSTFALDTASGFLKLLKDVEAQVKKTNFGDIIKAAFVSSMSDNRRSWEMFVKFLKTTYLKVELFILQQVQPMVEALTAPLNTAARGMSRFYKSSKLKVLSFIKYVQDTLKGVPGFEFFKIEHLASSIFKLKNSLRLGLSDSPMITADLSTDIANVDNQLAVLNAVKIDAAVTYEEALREITAARHEREMEILVSEQDVQDRRLIKVLDINSSISKSFDDLYSKYKGVVKGMTILDRTMAISASSRSKITGVANAAMEKQLTSLMETGELSAQSFVDTMLRSVKAELIAIAAKSTVQALYQSALGIAALARYDGAAAGLHFQAAGQFALIGAASYAAAGGLQSLGVRSEETPTSAASPSSGQSTSGPEGGNNDETLSLSGEEDSNVGQPPANVTINIVNQLSDQNWQDILETQIVPGLKTLGERDIKIDIVALPTSI